MKLLAHSFRFLALFCIASLAHASEASANFVKLLNEVHSMKASFTQIVYNNRGKSTQKSFGKMAMERPGKFRWDVVKPIPQLIIANGSKLWIYDPDLSQLTIRSLKKAAGESPALLLSHDNASIENTYNVEEMNKDTPKWRWFSLTPKQKGNMFDSIQMGFVNNQIQEMHLKDNLGQTTKVEFQNAQYNLAMSPSLFNFKPSAKIDVIDETHKKN